MALWVAFVVQVGNGNVVCYQHSDFPGYAEEQKKQFRENGTPVLAVVRPRGTTTTRPLNWRDRINGGHWPSRAATYVSLLRSTTPYIRTRRSVDYGEQYGPHRCWAGVRENVLVTWEHTRWS